MDPLNAMLCIRRKDRRQIEQSAFSSPKIVLSFNYFEERNLDHCLNRTELEGLVGNMTCPSLVSNESTGLESFSNLPQLESLWDHKNRRGLRAHSPDRVADFTSHERLALSASFWVYLRVKCVEVA